MQIPLSDIISSLFQFINSVMEFGISLPRSFGIPETITIGNITIQMYHVFGLLLSFFVFAAVFESLPKLLKYIGALLLIFYLLTVLASII